MVEAGVQVGAFLIFSSVAAALDHLTDPDPPSPGPPAAWRAAALRSGHDVISKGRSSTRGGI